MSGNHEQHPCFNREVVGKVSRIHLPLVKSCNIQCNYCNRSYNCPNENRPGVTSQLIKPEDIYKIIKESLLAHPDLKIVGVAGPGEAFAEPDIIYESFKIIRKHFPELKLCLSSNGYALVDSIDLIKELNINYITVTINTLNPDTALKIYNTDNINLFLDKQTEGIKVLKKLDTIVKVNSVVIPGINLEDIPEVAKFAGSMGVFAQNLIPFYPVKGSVFEKLREPSKEEMEKLRFDCSGYIKQIAHCKRCRADAVGNLLEEGKLVLNRV